MQQCTLLWCNFFCTLLHVEHWAQMLDSLQVWCGMCACVCCRVCHIVRWSLTRVYGMSGPEPVQQIHSPSWSSTIVRSSQMRHLTTWHRALYYNEWRSMTASLLHELAFAGSRYAPWHTSSAVMSRNQHYLAKYKQSCAHGSARVL